MYNYNDIQNMIEQVNQSKTIKEKLLSNISNTRDRSAIIYVLNEGYYEAFDRYDSDVCEQFIDAYLKATG